MASDLLRFALKAKDNNRLGLGENSQSRVGGSMIINVTVDAEPSPSSSNTNIQTSNVLNRLNPTMNRLGGSTARLQASNAKLNGSSLNLAENRQGYKTSTLTINGAFLAEQNRQSMSLHPEFGHRSLLTKSFRNIASAQGRPKKIKHRTSLAVDKELDSNTIVRSFSYHRFNSCSLVFHSRRIRVWESNKFGYIGESLHFSVG